MRSDKDNSDTIRKALEEVLPPKSVLAVHTRRDVDHDGDPVLWVRVVLEDGLLPLRPQPGLSIGVRIFSRLAEEGEEAFPVTTFLTETDEKDAGALAA